MAGRKQYIIDKGWGKQVDLNKVRYICNGIYGELYTKKIGDNVIYDKDLAEDSIRWIYKKCR